MSLTCTTAVAVGGTKNRKADEMTPMKQINATIAREEAVSHTLHQVMSLARELGAPTTDPVMAIFDDRVARQARSILIDALVMSYGINSKASVKVLGLIRALDWVNYNFHENTADIWEKIKDIADAEEEEYRELI